MSVLTPAALPSSSWYGFNAANKIDSEDLSGAAGGVGMSNPGVFFGGSPPTESSLSESSRLLYLYFGLLVALAGDLVRLCDTEGSLLVLPADRNSLICNT